MFNIFLTIFTKLIFTRAGGTILISYWTKIGSGFQKDKTQICENVGRHNGDNTGLRTRPKYNAYFPGPYIY
jgi:hypothetical protein